MQAYRRACAPHLASWGTPSRSEEVRQIRWARRLQEVVGWVLREEDRAPVALPQLSPTDRTLDAAAVVRQKLGVTPAEQLAWETPSEAFRSWREVLEGLGILVVQLGKSREVQDVILKLRDSVSAYNIPYLALPVTTPKDVALDVFIKMNTSAAHLTTFDIVVAQLEEVTGQSLHDLVATLQMRVPEAASYRDVGNWVLDVAALREDRPPARASYARLVDGAALDGLGPAQPLG